MLIMIASLLVATFAVGYLTARPPTQKMAQYVLSICNNRNLPLPDMLSFDDVRKFLNKYGDRRLMVRKSVGFQCELIGLVIILGSILWAEKSIGIAAAAFLCFWWAAFTARQVKLDTQFRAVRMIQALVILFAAYFVWDDVFLKVGGYLTSMSFFPVVTTKYVPVVVVVASMACLAVVLYVGNMMDDRINSIIKDVQEEGVWSLTKRLYSKLFYLA